MPLLEMKAMLHHAHEKGYAIGGFEVVDRACLVGVMEAAERCQSPVMLSLSEKRFGDCDPETLFPAVEAAAHRASVPVAIHFDHGSGLESAVTAIRLGCNGIMLDVARDASETGRAVEVIHGCGVPVEGWIGEVAVEAAERDIRQSGVDFVALKIGSGGKDDGRLQAIHDRLQMPIVIHAARDEAAARIEHLIRCGVAKIQAGSLLEEAAGRAVSAFSRKGYVALFRHVASAVAGEAERCMRLWGGAGRASEVLSHCPAWESVEHLITYNVEHHDSAEVSAMIEEGRRVLTALPGVRSVETGEAVALEKARYRYCWLVRFTHQAVIDSYRDHPLHVAYADEFFRPAAQDRMSIDYRLFKTLKGIVNCT